jgi:acyl-coenzyme A synthetase/AMP-(fatty) acid ligase
MPLIERFLDAVARRPDAPAFVGGVPITYRGALALLSNTVRALHESGVVPGEVVAVTMSQSPPHLLVVLALARLGAVSLSVAPVEKEADRAALFSAYGVRRVVSDRDDASVPGVPLLLLRGVGAKGDEHRLDYGTFMPSGDTPMRIGLTSGTAGARKGILLTHEGFVRRLSRRHYGEGGAPRVLPPNLHVTSALQLSMHALLSGGAVVFPPGYDRANFLAAIERHSVTHVTMPAAHLSLMLDALPPDHAPFPSITHLRLQGGLPSPGFIERARSRFSPHVYVPYSTTEVGVIAMATPATLAVAPRSSGHVAPGARVEIVDANGSPVAAGESGEIRVQVDGMPSSYAGADQGVPPRFRGGWFHPQDRGHFDADGLLYVEGRVDEVINLGGRKLAPRHAEAMLEDFPGVREAAVFLYEDARRDPRVAVAIVAAPELDWKALDAYAREKLEIFAPSRYDAVKELPRNANGKLLRKKLS